MIPLRQSTASQTFSIGAFVDDTDFKSVENGLTIANTDIKLKKNGATAVNKNSGGGTSDVNGMYAITLDATDTNTVGKLQGSVDVTGALVVWFDCYVYEEAVYDLMFPPAASGDVKLQGVVHAGATIPTVSVNTDMRGTDGVDTATMRGTDDALLAVSAPSNWGSMVISGSGAVDSLVQGYLNTTLTESSAGRINNNFEFFYDNSDAQTTQVVDDVGGGGGGGTDWTASERNEIRGRLGVTGTTAAGGNTPTLSLQSSIAAVQAVTDLIPDSGAMTSIAQATALATVDGNVDDIKAVTVQFNFTTAGIVDSNTLYVNNVEVDGVGSVADPWGPI